MNIAKKIIDEVADKMLDNRIVMEDIAIVPNVFLIYLHKDDHVDIKYFLNTLREQIIIRLIKEVDKRSGKSSKNIGKFKRIIDFVIGSEVIGGNHKIVVPNDWDVNFMPTDRDVLVGDMVFQIQKDEVCVVSSFTEEGSDSNNLGSQLKTFVTVFKSEGKEVENHVVNTAKPIEREFVDLVGNLFENPPLNNSNVFAVLESKQMGDDITEKFEMTKDKIIVGRDTDADFVLLRASNKVSRKHLEITFKDGIFFLRNFGIYGTMINGKSVPLSEKIVNNTTQELDKEVEIPDKARIAIAGGEVLINFSRSVIG